MHVHVQSVTFAFADSAPIVADATLTLGVGWTGLVGPNGAGKTSLLRLMAGELRPNTGQVRVAPEDMRVHLCAQELFEPSGELLEFACSQERAAHKLRATLRLPALERWTTLSPGERRRWQIGCALAREPELLLLDEPTNHLDREARGWLLQALRLHRGIGVVVSHDRTLLDQLTTQTLRLSRARLELYAGSYHDAQRVWQQAAIHAREARGAAATRVEVLERRVQAQRVAQRGAAANKSAGRRMKDRNDSDARGVLARTRADWADQKHGRSVQVLGRELARAQQGLAQQRVEKDLGGRVFAEFVPAPSARIGFVAAQLIAAGVQPVLELPAITLQRDDRVWVTGPNGAGKSTLLRWMTRQLSLAQSELLILPQEIAPAHARALLSQLSDMDRAGRGRVLNIVAALGVDPDRLLASEQPSPGEARKLLLALGFAKQAKALVLDEPENHLDLAAVERIESALVEYPGALYLVTHDETLAQRCTRQIYRIVPTSAGAAAPAQLIVSNR